MPSKTDALGQFKKDDLVAVASVLGVEITGTKDDMVEALGHQTRERLVEGLAGLSRTELKAACRRLGLDDGGKVKAEIAARLLGVDAGQLTVPQAPTAKPRSRRSSPGKAVEADVEPVVSPEPVRAPSTPRPLRTPSTRSVLMALGKQRLFDLTRQLQIAVDVNLSKDRQIERLLEVTGLGFAELLQLLGRDELKLACREHGLDDSGRARPSLMQRLLGAHGEDSSDAHRPLFDSQAAARWFPVENDIVQVRHRQYLVDSVIKPEVDGESTRVSLTCLDDDAQGRSVELLWDLELGARILQPEAQGLGKLDGLDQPRTFGAYLHALKWNAVTATDDKLFQAPFRAGIRLLNHQMTALMKALALPRANLFVADDVGLGKTIEAGLVLQELLLRQRVEFVLIVCPPSVALQWRDEMQKRFGLRFEIYNRHLVLRRRQERGFGVNPWSTHNRFIVTYPILRRPEYRDPLLQHLGDRVRKSLLILDEAHTAAPASASTYAVDSQVTRVIRDVAPRFENRLFLSATPHNGHSNSFAALLELLDPQRFTRGVPVRSVSQLEPIMVRRLKSDLKAAGTQGFPDRQLVQIELVHDEGGWSQRVARVDPALVDQGRDDEPGVVTKQHLAAGDRAELQLKDLLDEYTRLMKPARGKGQLVFINLQKRLLSSIEAFYRTLQVHARRVSEGKASTQLDLGDLEEDEYGADDETLDARADVEDDSSSRLLQSPEGRARELLQTMLKLAEQRRGAPCAKVLSLLQWIRDQQCPAVALGASPRGASKAWSDRRVIVFTEYGDTKRYLLQLLRAAVEDTDAGPDRIMVFHGGMSDEQRDEVQTAFNSDPAEHPVRILVATDAAREGVNLQGHCADLFHFDLPWNPARVEQRNGRIDRALQPQPEVRCHYFSYAQRREDTVLRTLVRKIERIKHELGSLSGVVMEQYAEVLDRGIADDTLALLDQAEQLAGKSQAARQELEAQRLDPIKLAAEIDQAADILNHSRRFFDVKPELLREALDEGLRLCRVEPLRALADKGPDDLNCYQLPELGEGWQRTLDTLRRPRRRDEAFWDWRRVKPVPVVFEPPSTMTSQVAHLHLQHPVVQRLLSRFLAQGFSADDLSRVTVLRNRHDAMARVIAFGRLSLFGAGATRLHDQLVSVAAPWLEEGKGRHLQPFAEAADRKALDMLEQLLAESPTLDGVGARVQQRLLQSAASDFATLWAHIKVEADAIAHDAEQKLATRGGAEALALRQILEAQREAIQRELGAQLEFGFGDTQQGRREAEQWQQDRKYMQRRLDAIAHEIATEPEELHRLYRVQLRRLQPVGLVYLWPATRG